MRRRQFIALLGGATAWSGVLRAQSPEGKVPRTGILLPGPLASRTHQWDAFRETLRPMSYQEGENIFLEFRPPEKEGDPLDDLAAQLVRRKVDIIIAVGDRAVQSAKHATSTIPIVMCPSSDPVALGFVASLGRPGGNITGFSILSADLAVKRLEILKEIVPKLSRVAVLWTSPESSFRATDLAARAMKIEVLSLKASNADDVEKAFDTAAASGAGAIVVPTGPIFFGLRVRIRELAQRYHLPGMYFLPAFAYAGGLLVYGPSETGYYRHAAIYVDRILKGAKPSELPVEQPSRFELILNMKTAKALRLMSPQSLLLRADEVIE